MEQFREFIEGIGDREQKNKLIGVLEWTKKTFPELEPRLAWGHPMFTHHGTFIISYSPSKVHLAVSPEEAALVHFADRIAQAGYSRGRMILRMPWDGPFNLDLLRDIIQFNLEDKKDMTAFWRRPAKAD